MSHQQIAEKSFCMNEYDTLKKVILCEPKYMTIRDVINDTQKHFKDVGIDIEKAMQQHKEFVQTLKTNGVEVILLPPDQKYPEQVFTRDIGFTIGQLIFVADMASIVRQGEEEILNNWLQEEDVSYYNIVGAHIEGGDVIIDHPMIYVGISDRTTKASIKHLESILPMFKVIPVPFKNKYLHLDCVFNILSPTEALIYQEAFANSEIELLSAHFDLIEVSKEEQFTLGTNVLSIGHKKILSLPVNKHVNTSLRAKGFTVIEVDISEIIKSGGSFRCCTMPIIRKS